VPAHWKNLEFTGANIRRKEQQTNVWTITLQDKAWGGYTLVLTYDYQFDPRAARSTWPGAHALGVERENRLARPDDRRQPQAHARRARRSAAPRG